MTQSFKNPPAPTQITPAQFRKMFRGSVVVKSSGSPRVVFHGTDANFAKFEKKGGKRSILFTVMDVPSCGYFFSPYRKDAQGYGRNVITARLIMKKPLWNYYKNANYGIDRVPPKLAKDLAYILRPLIKKDEGGNEYADIGARRTYVKTVDADWIYEFIQNGLLVWDALDNCEVVARMIERGYDGAFVQERDDYSGHSLFVVSDDQIVVVPDEGQIGEGEADV